MVVKFLQNSLLGLFGQFGKVVCIVFKTVGDELSNLCVLALDMISRMLNSMVEIISIVIFNSHKYVELDSRITAIIIGFGFVILTVRLIYTAKLLQKLKLSLKEATLQLNLAKEKINLDQLELKQKGDLILQLKTEIKNLNLQEEALKLELEGEKDKRLCITCQERVKDILFKPCRHVCLCEECFDHEVWIKCPLCRQNIHSTIKFYL